MATRVLTDDELEQLPSMWKSPGFVATLVAVGAAFSSWLILLPVVPLSVIENGGSDALAGATTGVFMATTVITQIFTPRALRSFGYNPVMVVAAFLLGVPAIGHLISMDAVPVLLVSAVRGIGFGALTVAGSALVAELVPSKFLGKASGMLGIFIGVSQMVFLPTGLAVANTAGPGTAYILGTAIALVAVVMCLRIPNIRAAAKSGAGSHSETRGEANSGADTGVPSAAIWKLVTIPAVALCSLSMSFGAITSFLPAAVLQLDPVSGSVIAGVMLSITGGAAMIFRYSSGVIADRRGTPGITMIPGQVLAFTGIALMALVIVLDAQVWWLVLAAVLFGAGFGTVQNEALLAMFFRLPRSRVSEASAIWNISFDSGTGIGSFLLGFVAAQLAYHGAFIAGAVLILVGIGATVADTVVGRHRSAAKATITSHP